MLLIAMLSILLIGICLFVPYYLLMEEKIEEQRKQWIKEQKNEY